MSRSGVGSIRIRRECADTNVHGLWRNVTYWLLSGTSQVRALSRSSYTPLNNHNLTPPKTGCIDTQLMSSPVTILPDNPKDHAILDLEQAMEQGVTKPEAFLPFSITPFHLAPFMRNYQTEKIYDVRSTWVGSETCLNRIWQFDSVLSTDGRLPNIHPALHFLIPTTWNQNTIHPGSTSVHITGNTSFNYL